MRMRMAVLGWAIMLVTGVRAGELNIVGKVEVVSNLTVNSLRLGGQTRSTWPSATEGGATTLSNGVLDTSLTSFYAVTLTTNVAWDFQGHVAGRSFTLKVAQDAVGGWTNAWGTNVLWAGGIRPTLTTHAERWDLLRFVDDGANWLGIVEGLSYRVPCTTNCQYALQFDGSSYVQGLADCGTIFDSAFTIEMWFKGQATLGTDRFYIDTGGYGYITAQHAGGPYVQGTYTADPSTWHHLAVEFDGSAWMAYLDGASFGSTVGSGSIPSSTGLPFFIGKYASSWGTISLTSTIDELRISNYVRYTNDFSATLPTSLTVDPETVGYWKFNEGAGTATTNETSNIAGTLEGNPEPTWVEGR